LKYIKSSENQIFKELVKLKNRKKTTLGKNNFLVEGLRFVIDALKDANIINLIVSDEFLENNEVTYKKLCLDNSLKDYSQNTIVLSKNLFNNISDTKNPQGIAALVEYNSINLADLLNREGDLVLILDSIMDPGNIGTIIRTCEACNGKGIILLNNCVDILNSKVLRSTMGSIFRIPVIKLPDVNGLKATLSSANYTIYAADGCSKNSCYDISFNKNTALIIGNEANGISDAVFSICDKKVSIPIIGKTESLNASVAAGILMFEYLRQTSFS
jgi:RNA methyltransferase, TrmH family